MVIHVRISQPMGLTHVKAETRIQSSNAAMHNDIPGGAEGSFLLIAGPDRVVHA